MRKPRIKEVKTKGKSYHVNEWEDSILLRYQFSLNGSIDAMQSQSKYYKAKKKKEYKPFCWNWQANAKT